MQEITTIIVETDFVHAERSYTVHGTWTRGGGCFAAPARITIKKVVLRSSGATIEPLEGGGLHAAAVAAIQRSAMKGSVS